MVRKDQHKIIKQMFLASAALLAAFSLTGCSSAGGSSITQNSAYAYKDEDRFGDDEEEEKVSKMQRPQQPPEGVTYEEWKNIQYTEDTIFDCRSFAAVHVRSGSIWTMTDSELEKPYTIVPEDYGYSLESDAVESPIRILDARIETIGGEMKLRSSGYVKVVIEMESRGTIKVWQDNNNYNHGWGSITWWNVQPEPADLYTGTAFLNYNDEDDGFSRGIYVGEADVSDMVKSDVSWNGRIYRIYVSYDSKNASWAEDKYETKGSYTIRTIPMQTYDTLTFLLPADYDGLILQIPKDDSWKKEYSADIYGNSLDVDDYYADMLTDFIGEEHDPDDYYFIKVSDLLEKFK